MYIWNQMRERFKEVLISVLASLMGHVGMAYVLSVVYCCQARAWRCVLLISGILPTKSLKKASVATPG
jgi:uncharacterized membrane protein YagU involved in acid resistance